MCVLLVAFAASVLVAIVLLLVLTFGSSQATYATRFSKTTSDPTAISSLNAISVQSTTLYTECMIKSG